MSYASLHDRDSEPGGNGMSTQSIQAPISFLTYTYNHMKLAAGVLDEPFSHLTPLSGVAVQARQST